MIFSTPVKVGLIVLLSASVLGGVSAWGYKKGSAHVQQMWDKERATLLATALKVEQDNRAKEAEHRKKTVALEALLKETEAQYEEALAAVRTDFGNWMRVSEERAARYRSWAEAESGQQQRLADHAARLDAALEKGRSLVAEFKVSLGQCQRDLRILGEQIAIDRNLTGE